MTRRLAEPVDEAQAYGGLLELNAVTGRQQRDPIVDGDERAVRLMTPSKKPRQFPPVLVSKTEAALMLGMQLSSFERYVLPFINSSGAARSRSSPSKSSNAGPTKMPNTRSFCRNCSSVVRDGQRLGMASAS